MALAINDDELLMKIKEFAGWKKSNIVMCRLLVYYYYFVVVVFVLSFNWTYYR